MDYLISAHGSIDLNVPTFCPKKGQTIVLFSEPGKSMTTSLENNILFEKDILQDPCIADIDNCEKYRNLSKTEKDKMVKDSRSDKNNCVLFPLNLLSRGHKVYEKCRNLKCKFCQKFLDNFNEKNLPVSIWDHERCQKSGRGGMPDISLSFGPLVDNPWIWKYGIYPLPNQDYQYSKRDQSKYHIGLYRKNSSPGDDITNPILETCWEGSIPFKEGFIKILSDQGLYSETDTEKGSSMDDEVLEEYFDDNPWNLEAYEEALEAGRLDEVNEYRWEAGLDPLSRIEGAMSDTNQEKEVLRLVSNQKIINGKDKNYTTSKIGKQPKIYLSQIMEYLPSGTYFISACRSWTGKRYNITPRYKDIFYFITCCINSKYYPFDGRNMDIMLYPNREKYKVTYFFNDTMEFKVIDKNKNKLLLKIKEINYEILDNLSGTSRYYSDIDNNLIKLNQNSSKYNFTRDDLLIYPFIRREPYNLIKTKTKNYGDKDLEIGRRFEFEKNWSEEKQRAIILGKKNNSIIYNKYIRTLLDTNDIRYFLNPINCKLLNIEQPLETIYIRNYGYFGRLLKTRPYEYEPNNIVQTGVGTILLKKEMKYLLIGMPKYHHEDRLFLDINYHQHHFKNKDKEFKVPLQTYKLLNNNENHDPNFIKNHLVDNNNDEKIKDKGTIFNFITGISEFVYDGPHLFKKYDIYGDLFISLLKKLTNDFIFLDEPLNETNVAKISDILMKIKIELENFGYHKNSVVKNMFNDFLELVIVGNYTTVKSRRSDLIEYEWSHPDQNSLDKIPFLYQDEIETQQFREGSILAIYLDNLKDKDKDKDKLDIRNQLLSHEVIINNNPVIYILIVDPELNSIKNTKIYEMSFYDVITSLGFDFSTGNKYRKIIETKLRDKYGEINKWTDQPEILSIGRLGNDPDFINDLIEIYQEGEIDELDFAKIIEFFKKLKYKWTAVKFVGDANGLINIELIQNQDRRGYDSTFSLPKNFNRERRLSYLDFNNPKTNSIYILENLRDGYLNGLEQLVNKYWKFYLYKGKSFPNPIFYQLMEENGRIGEIIHNDDKTYLKLTLDAKDDVINEEYLDITEFEKDMFTSYREMNETSFFTRFPYNLKIGDIIYCLPLDAQSNNPDDMRYNKYRIVGYHLGDFLSYYYRVRDTSDINKEFSIDLTKNTFFYEDEIRETEQLKKLVLSRQESDLDRKVRF